MLGLPQGQAFTLQFGNFGGTNVGPVTLDSGGSDGEWDSDAGFLHLPVRSEHLPGRQSARKAAHNLLSTPVKSTAMTTRCSSTTASGESLVSAPAIPLPTTNVAFVLTTDFSTGSYSVVDLTSRNVFKDLKLGGVHSDAIARFFVNPSASHGRVYVVNRLDADSIQIIDPQLGFITPTNGELSVGNGTNPQDIVFVSANKAYVSRLASAQLVIINPTTSGALGELDLSSLVTPNDGDGSPEPAYMLMRNGLVYVALQHIDFTQPQLPKVATARWW